MVTRNRVIQERNVVRSRDEDVVVNNPDMTVEEEMEDVTYVERDDTMRNRRDRRLIRDEDVRPLYRGTQIVWYIFWILETLLVLRFLMRLLGANPDAGFTDFIYRLTAPFVAPFVYVFPSTTVDGGMLEWGTLLSLLVYWLIAFAIAQLFVMSRPVHTIEAKERLEEQERAVTP